MKKRKVGLHFNYDIDPYKAGKSYLLELTEVEEKRLLRRGCIYASKDAKYYKDQEPQKTVQEKPEETEEEVQDVQQEVVEEKPQEEVKEDVVNQDTEQTKVQTRRSKASKPKA